MRSSEKWTVPAGDGGKVGSSTLLSQKKQNYSREASFWSSLSLMSRQCGTEGARRRVRISVRVLVLQNYRPIFVNIVTFFTRSAKTGRLNSFSVLRGCPSHWIPFQPPVPPGRPVVKNSGGLLDDQTWQTEIARMFTFIISSLRMIGLSARRYWYTTVVDAGASLTWEQPFLGQTFQDEHDVAVCVSGCSVLAMW